jgi:hypothetical protein
LTNPRSRSAGEVARGHWVAAAYLEYPDAGDAGELVGGDGGPPRLGVGAVSGGGGAVAAAEAQAGAEAREAGRQRRLAVPGGAGEDIVAGAGVAHLSGERVELVETSGSGGQLEMTPARPKEPFNA